MTRTEALEWCNNPDCGMRKWRHRLLDCDIEYLTEQARKLNYPYPLPEDKVLPD